MVKTFFEGVGGGAESNEGQRESIDEDVKYWSRSKMCEETLQIPIKIKLGG